MALGKVILEGFEAASGGILLNLFNKLFDSGDKEKIGQVRQAIVRSGILPFSWTGEDEAKLMARFGKLEEGLSANEASTLSEFLAEKCTPQERKAFRCSLALINEVVRIIKNTTDDKAAKKTQTTEKEEIVRDDGLGFLKKLADPSLDDEKRYTICKGLGLFDFSHTMKEAWEKINGVFLTIGTALGSINEKIAAILIPQPPATNAKWHEKLFHRLKNLC